MNLLLFFLVFTSVSILLSLHTGLLLLTPLTVLPSLAIAYVLCRRFQFP